jgi:hypothetical protein
MRLICLALTAALVITSSRTSMASDAILRLSGTIETVYSWRSQRCSDSHFPDSPARAVRLFDGRVALWAAHSTNIPFLGTGFRDLHSSCEIVSRGSESADANDFDDRVWVQALAPLDDGRLLALASHEYSGKRHAGHCNVQGGLCWYSAITALTTDANRLEFRTLPRAYRVIARPPEEFDPSQARRVGFFSVTNMVFEGEYAYLMAFTEGIAAQPQGMCLLRAPKRGLITGWRALHNGQFSADLSLPREGSVTVPQPLCDIIGAGSLQGNVQTIIRIADGGPWVAAFVRLQDRSRVDAPPGGVYYSTSSDLRTWGPPRLLMEMETFIGQREAKIYYQYPSLIDHQSPSPIFDQAATALHLYLTRFNFWPNRQDGANRDLVRVPVAIER